MQHIKQMHNPNNTLNAVSMQGRTSAKLRASIIRPRPTRKLRSWPKYVPVALSLYLNVSKHFHGCSISVHSLKFHSNFHATPRYKTFRINAATCSLQFRQLLPVFTHK